MAYVLAIPYHKSKQEYRTLKLLPHKACEILPLVACAKLLRATNNPIVFVPHTKSKSECLTKTGLLVHLVVHNHNPHHTAHIDSPYWPPKNQQHTDDNEHHTDCNYLRSSHPSKIVKPPIKHVTTPLGSGTPTGKVEKKFKSTQVGCTVLFVPYHPA